MAVATPTRPKLLDELPERIPIRLTGKIMDDADPYSNYSCFIGLALQRQHRLSGDSGSPQFSVGTDYVHIYPVGLGTVVTYRIPDDEAHLIETTMDASVNQERKAALETLTGRTFDLVKAAFLM